MKLRNWMLLPLLLCVARPANADEPYFELLGDLPGGFDFSLVYALSDDGTTAVGLSSSAWASQFSMEAFRWTRGEGMVGLGGLGELTHRSEAYGVSGDGSVVVGFSINADDFGEAFRWTSGEGMSGLGDFAGGAFDSTAHGISADSSVIVGRGRRANRSEAFRWTVNTGWVGLGVLQGDSGSSAKAASANGNVIVGVSTKAVHEFQAFRWKDGVMQGLGDLPGGDFESQATDVSADGSVVVGYGDPGYSNGGAFRWTAEDGMVNLGFFPGRPGRSGASAVSADGSIVVGSSQENGQPAVAFIWDESHGMRVFQDILEDEYGLDLRGLNPTSVSDISADGRTFVGTTDGVSWIAHIPEPGTWLLLAVGLGAIRRR